MHDSVVCPSCSIRSSLSGLASGLVVGFTQAAQLVRPEPSDPQWAGSRTARALTLVPQWSAIKPAPFSNRQQPIREHCPRNVFPRRARLRWSRPGSPARRHLPAGFICADRSPTRGHVDCSSPHPSLLVLRSWLLLQKTGPPGSVNAGSRTQTGQPHPTPLHFFHSHAQQRACPFGPKVITLA